MKNFTFTIQVVEPESSSSSQEANQTLIMLDKSDKGLDIEQVIFLKTTLENWINSVGTNVTR
ncbi:MAG: hypothetical protein MJE63_27505 [Proteobacteria bacterium]|nr:hypothetical protein [Pseudomonadota bacterium]